ncbi:hypothetical protein EIN_151350 [Entamoeba invadens IP1]|uniref:Rab-GAP TBC domain-containing protein n=1 Tax=Entamoeba invadens IP1 TaxID=370355 RepID=A0A0A1UC03_ENTIV|nr:hypothetical protein EIN_151350 [Entamoeba invadens IP1]ELP91238.1 hypothetical protein EIN_151350 [Entamoeba invadens IP1]|eukprot:XP_004258009.1 hypothetical protein EIN_151350 [Entamoeba invadens IP1]
MSKNDSDDNEKLFPDISVVGTFFASTLGSFFKKTSTAVSNFFVDKVTFDGNDDDSSLICHYLLNCDYNKVQQICCFGIPRKVRGFVWYALLLKPEDANDIRNLHNPIQHKRYWQNVTDNTIETTDKLNAEDAEVIDWDVARTYPIGYDRLFQLDVLRTMLRRILRMFLYFHPHGYFQGLNDIVSIAIIVLLDMYTKQQLTEEKIIEIPLQKMKQIESSSYAFLEAIDVQLSVNIHSELKEIHAVGLMEDFITTLKKMNSRALELEEQILKQQTWRWFVCVFSREFKVEQVIMIWDRLVSDPRANGFRQGIVCMAAAIIESVLMGINDLKDIEQINSINRNYWKNIDDIAFSKILNKAIEIRVNLFQRKPQRSIL